MKAVWTPTGGGGAATLTDDLATPRTAMKMEQLGGQCLEYVEPLALAAFIYRTPMGNVSGNCIFTGQRTHASRDAAATYFSGEYARQGQAGSLVITVDSVTLTMNPANLIGVAVAEFNGLQWTIRYTFGIATIVLGP